MFNNQKPSRWTLCSISIVQIIAICCYFDKQTTLMSKGIIQHYVSNAIPPTWTEQVTMC